MLSPQNKSTSITSPSQQVFRFDFQFWAKLRHPHSLRPEVSHGLWKVKGSGGVPIIVFQDPAESRTTFDGHPGVSDEFFGSEQKIAYSQVLPFLMIHGASRLVGGRHAGSGPSSCNSSSRPPECAQGMPVPSRHSFWSPKGPAVRVALAADASAGVRSCPLLS
jgi:hypothetical protein